MIADAPRQARAPEILMQRAWAPYSIADRVRAYKPKTDVGRVFKQVMAAPGLDNEMRTALLDTVSRIWVVQSQLAAKVYRGLDGVPWVHPGDSGYDLRHLLSLPGYDIRKHGTSYHPLLNPLDHLWLRLQEEYGVVCQKVITNAGVNYMVTDFAAGVGNIANLHFHGIGTGTNAEAATDTILQTELTTEYNPDSTRATGSAVDTAGTPHTFVTLGTNTLDSGTPAITEHGIFSQAATGAASATNALWDRSKFSAINLVGANGDGLASTYTLTINAGG